MKQAVLLSKLTNIRNKINIKMKNTKNKNSQITKKYIKLLVVVLAVGTK